MVQIYGTFVGEIVEQVEVLLSYLASLLVSEYKIDPGTNVMGDIV